MKRSFKINAALICLSFVFLAPSISLAATSQPVAERRDLTEMPATWLDLSQVTNSDSRTKLLLVGTRVSNGRAAALFARVSFAGSDAAKKELDTAFNTLTLKNSELFAKSKQEVENSDEDVLLKNNPNFQTDYSNFLLENLGKNSLVEIVKAEGVSFAVAIWSIAHPEDVKIVEIASAAQLDPVLVGEYITKRFNSTLGAWQSLPVDWAFGPSYLVWSLKKSDSSGSENTARTTELYRYKLSNGVTEKIWTNDTPLVSTGGYNWNDVTDISTDYNSILVMGIERNEGGGYSGNLFRWSESGFKFLPVESGFKPLKKSYYFDTSQTQVLEGSHYVFLPVTNKGKYDHTEVIDKVTGKQFVVRVPGMKEITKQYCTIYAEQLICRESWTEKNKPTTQYAAYDMKTKKVSKFVVPMSTNTYFVARENSNLFVNYYSSTLNANQLWVYDIRTKKSYEMTTPSLFSSDIAGLEGTDFVGYSMGHAVLSSQLSADRFVRSSELSDTVNFGTYVKEIFYEQEWRDFERMFMSSPVFSNYRLNK